MKSRFPKRFTALAIFLTAAVILVALLLITADQNQSDLQAFLFSWWRKPQNTCLSVSQYGITWTFPAPVVCGQFLNGQGDWWVVGPIKLIGISPAPANGRNGFEINPNPKVGYHPYDSRDQYNYKAGLQPPVPAPGAPLTVNSDASIVSTISNPEQTECQIGTSGPKGWWMYNQDKGRCSTSYLKTAAVLTVLRSQPPADSFRPGYAGTVKTLYRASQLRTALLPKLAVPNPQNLPALAELERDFERVRLDHIVGWSGQYIIPNQNSHQYAQFFAEEVSDNAAYLLLNVPNKEKVVQHFVQLGIDLYSIALAGGFWPADGGHGSGRENPITISGLLLGDQQMMTVRDQMNVSPKENAFGPICQTYYDRAGVARWGLRHCQDPNRPDWNDETNPYRTCCTSHIWIGDGLALRLLGLKPLVSHDAFFDYLDRWMKENGGASSAFVLDMWRKYRNYVPEQVILP